MNEMQKEHEFVLRRLAERREAADDGETGEMDERQSPDRRR